MRIAVLVKQVPRVEEMALDDSGRLRRDGVDLEMNAYCRRAVSKGVEIATASGGTCVVFTLGPTSAEDVLREAVAWGADTGILVSDPAFAGSDTLATARALAAALAADRPWDLILLGRNSIDADTGQVGPELAELLDLPFVAGVRELHLDGRAGQALCEYDDTWRTVTFRLPAVVSVAERLTNPCKAPPEDQANVPPERLRLLSAAQLGAGPWGTAASRTAVDSVEVIEVPRHRVVLAGSPAQQVRQAIDLLGEWGQLESVTGGFPERSSRVSEGIEPTLSTRSGGRGVVGDVRRWSDGDPVLVVLAEPEHARLTRELVGEAERLARAVAGYVVVSGPSLPEAGELAAWGADAAVELVGARVEEDVASAMASWCESRRPWIVLVPGTLWGREVAGRLAARLDAGLTGDAIGLRVRNGRLVCRKPAFGGRLVASISSSSDVQLATVRPGVLPLREPRRIEAPVPVEILTVRPRRRVEVSCARRYDDVEPFSAAQAVVAVGMGVGPDEYGQLDYLRELLGAEMAATRRVTDAGWLQRTRQVGITGRSIAPQLYLAIGISGKINHMIGTLGAHTVIAVNNDPGAPIFDWADIGIVADWHEVVPALVEEIRRGIAESRGI
jgi:electron transfer flavoprotein alpha subunit